MSMCFYLLIELVACWDSRLQEFMALAGPDTTSPGLLTKLCLGRLLFAASRSWAFLLPLCLEEIGSGFSSGRKVW